MITKMMALKVNNGGHKQNKITLCKLCEAKLLKRDVEALVLPLIAGPQPLHKPAGLV